jgi:hypothetical protein
VLGPVCTIHRSDASSVLLLWSLSGLTVKNLLSRSSSRSVPVSQSFRPSIKDSSRTGVVVVCDCDQKSVSD